MKISRRRMLEWLAVAGAGAAAAPSLLSRAARAQPAAAPKRMVVVFTHNNQLSGSWLPTGGETDFTLSPILSPFEPFRDRLLVLHELASDYHDHNEGYRSCLTEYDGLGPSIDQLVAQRIGNSTRIRSLELGVQCDGSSVSYSGPRLRLPPMEHPRSVYDRIVGAAVDDPETRDRLATQGSAVLGAVAQRYEALSSRLAPEERRLIDAHHDELVALETRVSDPASVRACVLPPPPSIDAGSAALRDPDLFPDVLRAQLDNVVTALTCDVTRVASVMFSKGGSLQRYTWLPTPVMDVAHDVAHGFVNATGATLDDAPAQWASIHTWHAEQIAYLCAQLDAIVEDDGSTLLDNTIVLWVSELGLGTTGTHSRRNVPVVALGGGGGALRTGRFLDMGGRPYADFLLTLAHAMGYDDVTSFGVNGTSPIAELLA